MRIMIRCSHGEEEWVGLLEMPTTLKKELLLLRDAVVELETRHASLAEISLWNVGDVRLLTGENGLKLDELLDRDEELRAQFEEHLWAFVPDDFPRKEFLEGDFETTGDVLLHATKRAFYWTTWFKHGEGEKIESEAIPYEDIVCPTHGIDDAAEPTCVTCLARAS